MSAPRPPERSAAIDHRSWAATVTSSGTRRSKASSTPTRGRRDSDVEASLRPRSLTEFVGQVRVREQLELVLSGAKLRGTPPDHVLLAGPPGLGKTSLAMIIAAELGAALRLTSGPALERAGDLAAILSNLVEGDVLFIDEIHRIARPAEEMLYLAMEDFRVDVMVGKGPGATSIPLEIAPFTLVGATTRSGQLTSPLRDRFGFTAHMEFYSPAELTTVITRSAAHPGHRPAPGRRQRRSPAGPGAHPGSPTGCCAGCATTPRSGPTASITREIARAALAVYDVDELGLDRLDRAVLSALCRSFGGGPVGLTTLAVAVGEEPRHGRGGVRAVPGAGGHAGPHAAGPGGDPGGLGAPGSGDGPGVRAHGRGHPVRRLDAGWLCPELCHLIRRCRSGVGPRRHRRSSTDDHARFRYPGRYKPDMLSAVGSEQGTTDSRASLTARTTCGTRRAASGAAGPIQQHSAVTSKESRPRRTMEQMLLPILMFAGSAV